MPQLLVSDGAMQALLVLAEGERLDPAGALALMRAATVHHGHQAAMLADLVGPVELCVAIGEPPERGEDATWQWPQKPSQDPPIERPPTFLPADAWPVLAST